MIGGTKVPFQVAQMELKTLKQPSENNECGFYIMWAMLRYLGRKSDVADDLVCIISFISVNSTKRSIVFSYICAFLYHLF
jgi:hypothetical protein